MKKTILIILGVVLAAAIFVTAMLLTDKTPEAGNPQLLGWKLNITKIVRWKVKSILLLSLRKALTWSQVKLFLLMGQKKVG